MDSILVPIDGSELSLRALDAAIDLSGAVGASIELAYVVDLSKASMIGYGSPQCFGDCLDTLRDEGEKILQCASKYADEKGFAVRTELLQGSPCEEIVKLAARRDARWIVMGTHGRSGLSRFLVGSVAEGVLRKSRIPVLIVPMQRKAHRSSAA